MNELKHFGIKKRSGRYPWGSGERPYQGEGPIAGNKSPKRAIKQRKKDLKQRRTLTDEEIKQRIERIKLEKQFKEITEDDIAPGRNATKKVLSDAGKKVLGTVAVGASLYLIKAAVEAKVSGGDFKSNFKSAIDPKEFGESVFNGGPKKKK